MSYAGLFFGNFDEEGQLEGAGFDEVFVQIKSRIKDFFGYFFKRVLIVFKSHFV
jgi:transcription initiation factor TFIID subunit 1, fungi type